MKILLDTNIIIHREADRIVEHHIGQLFNWIDKLHYRKYIHPVTVSEIANYQNKKAVDVYAVKLDSYNLIKHELPLSERIQRVSQQIDVKESDIKDTHLLNEVFEGRMDIFITQDKKIHLKANMLGISNKVYKIQTFLEKATAENPDLVEYNVLAVKKADFAEVNIADSFFDSFREDYEEFNSWFISKFDEVCYVCYSDNTLTAFLYIKVEDESENYSEIKPVFSRKKRLKIGTLKVISNGYKIGERFLKIVFDNAIQYKVEEIYVTVFDKRPEQAQLIEMLKDWGFQEHGVKTTKNGDEMVLVRPFGKNLPVIIENPKLTYPFFSRNTRKYIIKIEPQYHTELFPDSINTREDGAKYTENEPHRNRIGKVYISHSKDRHLKSGDIIIVYRMGETKPKKYSSTVTSICIVQGVANNFSCFEDFYQVCNRRTMINKSDLENNWWNKYPRFRPFVIKFLYAHSLPTPKPTLNDLNRIGVIPDIMNMPRGFIEIDNNQFDKLVNFAYKPK
jgi:predicted nucleic acid-binding protein